MLLFLFILLFLSIDAYTSIPRTQVVIHLEKFTQKYNLLHIGVSFVNSHKNLRYDFRSFNNDKSCETTNLNRGNLRLMFPDLYIAKEFDDKTYKDYIEVLENDKNNIYSKNILWGITNKTFEEIILYEKSINKKYKLGIYDCRHYVNKFTCWCLDKPTPIWTLYKLWDEY